MKQKLSPKLIQWIPMGMFPAYVMLSVGFTYDEIMKELGKLNSKDAECWKLGLSEDATLINDGNWFALRRTVTNRKNPKKTKTMHYVIFKERFDFSDLSMCKLAHEVLHICQFFLRDVLDRDREIEAEAYLHTYLMEQCLGELRKKVPKKKKLSDKEEIDLDIAMSNSYMR
jgi:hypothetical protein